MHNAADIQKAAVEFQKHLVLPAVSNISYDELVLYLAERINVLLKDDFSALVQLLYRMDISEAKLRYLLQTNTGEMAATIMAKLMIERQLQKIETRRSFKKDDNIPDEEKW